jgi:hypothetical protein
MRWLYTTLGLLSASVCLVAFVYLRDRDTSGSRPGEYETAHADGVDTLVALGHGDCAGCTTQVLSRIGPRRWLVRITVEGRAQCLQIDLARFASTRDHGLTGVRRVRCAAKPDRRKSSAAHRVM